MAVVMTTSRLAWTSPMDSSPSGSSTVVVSAVTSMVVAERTPVTLAMVSEETSASRLTSSAEEMVTALARCPGLRAHLDREALGPDPSGAPGARL